MSVNYIDSEGASPGYTLYSTYLLISKNNTMAGWSTDESAMVEVWPLEVNVHVWTRSTQCSVDIIDTH